MLSGNSNSRLVALTLTWLNKTLGFSIVFFSLFRGSQSFSSIGKRSTLSIHWQLRSWPHNLCWRGYSRTCREEDQEWWCNFNICKVGWLLCSGDTPSEWFQIISRRENFAQHQGRRKGVFRDCYRFAAVARRFNLALSLSHLSKWSLLQAKRFWPPSHEVRTQYHAHTHSFLPCHRS